MKSIAIDLETDLFKPGYMAPKVICMSFANNEKTGLVIASEIESIAIDIFKNYDCIIGHYIAYDTTCLWEWFPKLRSLIWKSYDEFKIHCTKAREELLNISVGSKQKKLSLKDIVYRRFGIELDKSTWRTNYKDLENIPLKNWPNGAKQYAIDDSIYAYKIFNEQSSDAINSYYKMFENESARQSRYSFALHLTSSRGLMVDQNKVDSELNTINPIIQNNFNILKKEKLIRLVGKIERKDQKKIREFVEKSYVNKKNIPKTLKTNQIQLNEKVLKKCNDPIIDKLLEYESLIKIKSTYLDKLKEVGKNPVHTKYNVLKATGRTSSEKPNLQNQPRKVGIRECFISRPGFVFIFSDYDSQEMRTLAEACYQLTGTSVLGDRYKKDPDFDPHSYFAAWLMKISYEKAIELKNKDDKTLLERRQQSKAANFGFPGGMGVDAFLEYAKGYGVTMSYNDAKILRDNWFESWPEMRTYFQIISEMTMMEGSKITQLVSGRIRGGCSYTDGANTFFQGLAADASKYALYNVAKKCFDKPGTSALAGCRPIIFVHDEIGIEAPESYMCEAAKELEKTMENSMNEVCVNVPSRASAVITKRWSKKAKNIFDDKGNWIPWE